MGDDNNPCSRTAPCKTFAGAISQTASGGEISVLDPGGFGGVTITKAITIDGGSNIASVLVQGTNGIVVSAGANDTVILRNLSIDGIRGSGTGGINGVRFLSGAMLFIDNCTIMNFTTNGVDIALGANGDSVIRNTTFRNIAGNDVNAVATAGTAVVTVVNSSFGGPSLVGGGVLVGAHSVGTVTGSDFSNFATALAAVNGGNLSVDRSVIARSNTGVNTGAGSTSNLTNNAFVNNVTALTVAGTVASAQNNTVVGTTTNPNASLLPFK